MIKTIAYVAFLALCMCIYDSSRLAAAHGVPALSERIFQWKGSIFDKVSAISIDFNSGLSVFSSASGAHIETHDNIDCLVGTYFLFNIRDELMFDIDAMVKMSATVGMEFDDALIISYDAVYGPKRRVMHANGNGKELKRVEILLERARFANRLHDGADIVIAAPGAELGSENSQKTITLCDLDFRMISESDAELASASPQGELHLSFRDEATNKKTSARFIIADETGRQPLPSGDALGISRFGTTYRQLLLPQRATSMFGPSRYATYADGDYDAILPSGRYELTVTKGPEYLAYRGEIVILPGDKTQIEIPLTRWTDLPGKGWYSGDVHLHIERTSEENPSISAFLQAEDIHVSNLLEMGSFARSYFRQYAFRPGGSFGDGTYAIISGQETPRTGVLGHAIGLNTTNYLQSMNYFLFDETARMVHENGGLFGLAHVAFRMFHEDVSMAILAPSRLVDFVEILQFERLDTDLFYDFLNLGLQIAPVAGSDFPYFNIPGAERTYVYVEGEFSAEAWFRGLRAGRSFVTNGPILDLTINGNARPGETVHTERGDPVHVHAEVKINPDFGKVDRLELVRHGEVIARTERPGGVNSLALDHAVTADYGMWLAARAYGPNGEVAHTSAVFILPRGSVSTLNDGQARRISEKYKKLLLEAKDSSPQWRREPESDGFTKEALMQAWEAQRGALTKRIDEAIIYFSELESKSDRAPDVEGDSN